MSASEGWSIRALPLLRAVRCSSSSIWCWSIRAAVLLSTEVRSREDIMPVDLLGFLRLAPAKDGGGSSCRTAFDHYAQVIDLTRRNYRCV